MTITLESIQFRIPGVNNGAFSISRPGNNGGPRQVVSGPEWLLGVKQPVAFAGQASFVDISLLCSDMGPVQARIQATAANGHVLGDIAPQNLTGQNGRFAGRISLNAAHISAVGKSKIQWHWQVSSGQENFAFDTDHDIYTTIGQPTAPWDALGSDASATPWQEALDVACDWAGGATTSETILTAIASHHYHSGELKYGSDSYTEGSDTIPDEEGIFKLDKFLLQQAQSAVNGVVNEVDCADCATIVAIFGGLLGASTCVIIELDTAGSAPFVPADGNVLVGGEASSPGFGFHQVAWNIDDPDRALVWDFCLGRIVSGQAQPYTNLPFHPLSDPLAYPRTAFRPDTAAKLERLKQEIRQIKDTAAIFNLQAPIDPEKFDFQDWKDVFRDFVGLAFSNFVPIAIGAVLPVQTWRYQKQPRPWLVDSVYRLGPETIQVGVFECDSRSDAHIALYHLLDSQRVLPFLTWLKDKPIGDVLFYDTDGKSDLLLFARGNLVVRLQRNRGSEALLLELAQIIDSLLIHSLALIQQAATIAAGIFHDSFPIHIPGATSTVRFFSDAAGIVLSGNTAKLENNGQNQ